MKSFIRKWPLPVEFALVMTAAFGLFIASAWQMMPHGRRAEIRLDDSLLFQNTLTQVAIALGLMVFLKMRGYSRADFPFSFAPREWGRGVGLLAMVYASVVVAGSLAFAIMGQEGFTAGTMKVSVVVSPVVAVISSLINALYEELFVTAYVLRVLEKLHGLETAVVCSVLVRFLYHVYQGPQAVFTVIPIGFVFVLYFVRTRNLWPLMLAHAMVDIVSLSLAGNMK